MERCCVHHVEFGVADGRSVLKRLHEQFGFVETSRRISKDFKQWVVKSGKAVILVTQLEPSHLEISDQDTELNDDPYIVPWTNLVINNKERPRENRNNAYEANSVFNVALKVGNVGETVEQMVLNGAKVIKAPTKVTDKDGDIEIAVVKSCIGNVIHTLIDNQNFNGDFLPLFERTEQLDLHNVDLKEENSIVTHFDHIAFVCEKGSTSSILLWYEKTFGMQRFYMNSDEDVNEGFMIEDTGIGLRMKAMEYWKCAETGLTSSLNMEDSDTIKFVLVESLTGQGPNQVDIFLDEHGGPGVQHIGLYTNDIVTAVDTLQQKGTDLVDTPVTYYTEEGKLKEIKNAGYDVDVLQKNGILLDSEADPGTLNKQHNSEENEHNRYLLQKFTKPLFGKRTFFLEIIQRVGARGFGAGNITALWRAVQSYMNQMSSETKS